MFEQVISINEFYILYVVFTKMFAVELQEFQIIKC